MRARWVDAAYDQGGAYWGMPSRPGEYIYAATDYLDKAEYCEYTRACSAAEARENLDLPRSN